MKHSYRGDRSAYMLRSTMSRLIYANEEFPAHNTFDIKRGDILNCNQEFRHYKGELQIALKEMVNSGRLNIVGQIHEEELFLLDYLRPWSTFKLIE